MSEEIKEVKLKRVDSRFLLSRIGEIKTKWNSEKDADEMELLAINYAINEFLRTYPYGKYDKKD